MIYLDNSATTRVCKPAADAALECMTEAFGNASSLHRMGFEAEKIIEKAALQLCSLLGCGPGELLFTSGATESNNIALTGAVAARRKENIRIITTEIEHPSVYETVKQLEKSGYETIFLHPENGGYTPEAFCGAAGDKECIISFMAVNNETGYRMPFEQIIRAVRRKNKKAVIHIDATQAAGKIPLNLNALGADLVSFSGHKMYAPKGVGGLYIRKGTRLKPLFFGGGQQKGLRVGTEPVELIAAFGEAAEFCKSKMTDSIKAYETIRSRLCDTIKCEVNSNESCVPYIINVSTMTIKSEVMLHYLEQSGIYVSSGSACSKGRKSRVLKAFGFSDRALDTALRISPAWDTTAEQIDEFIRKVHEGMDTLAKLK